MVVPDWISASCGMDSVGSVRAATPVNEWHGTADTPVNEPRGPAISSERERESAVVLRGTKRGPRVDNVGTPNVLRRSLLFPSPALAGSPVRVLWASIGLNKLDRVERLSLGYGP